MSGPIPLSQINGGGNNNGMMIAALVACCCLSSSGGAGFLFLGKGAKKGRMSVNGKQMRPKNVRTTRARRTRISASRIKRGKSSAARAKAMLARRQARRARNVARKRKRGRTFGRRRRRRGRKFGRRKKRRGGIFGRRRRRRGGKTGRRKKRRGRRFGRRRRRCFSPETCIKLQNGETRAMKDLKLGDILVNGSIVKAIMQIKNESDPYYKLPGDILVTGSHYIKDGDVYKQVKNFSGAELTTQTDPVVSCLITSDHQVPIGDFVFWDWEDNLVHE